MLMTKRSLACLNISILPLIRNTVSYTHLDVYKRQEYEVDSFKYDPKFKPYQVLKIYPTPGSHVKDGRTIVLKVNPKTYAPVAVPDILDRYKFLAFRKLDLLGLKVGDTIYAVSYTHLDVYKRQPL